MSSVLVVQPDTAQAETLRDIAQRIGTDLVIVNSTSAAIDSIARKIPDLILLSTLLSPRDEDALISHLRSLEGASHLQTLTIPQFRAAGGGKKAEKSRGGLFSRKKTKAPVEVGCDPAVFAEEVLMQLRIAEDVRNRPVVTKPNVVPMAEPPPAVAAEPARAPQAWPDASSQADVASHVDALFDMPIHSSDLAAAAEPPAYVPYPVADVHEPPAYVPETGVFSPEAAAFDERAAPASSMTGRGPEAIASDEDEIDRIARELGLNLKILDEPVAAAPAPRAADENAFDFGAALDRARADADRRTLEQARKEGEAAEAIREAAIAEARAAAEREAREALAADLARVQAEAEAMREAAIAEARAAAEREAREKLDAELARVRTETELTVAGALSAERQAREKLDAELAKMRAETEVTVADALSRVKQEAEGAERLRTEAEQAKKDAERARAEAAEVAERLRAEAAAEADRARAEAERARAEAAQVAERLRAEAAAETERARAEAERLRLEAQEAFATDLARVRAEVEQSLAAQLDVARTEAERMRTAEAKAARDRATVETQLKAEIDRLKFVAAQTKKSDESETRRASEQIRHLESELAKVHANAEKRQAAQLDELRTQMAEMREAAAQHARAAAAEAVKSEVARATASSPELAPRKLNVVRMPSRPSPQPELLPIAESVAPSKPSLPKLQPPLPRPAEEPAAGDQSGRDYYSLWKPEPEAAPPPPPAGPEDERRIDFRRHMKWALLPVAACLLLVTNTGGAISTVARFVTPGEKPVMTVQPLDVEKPFIEVVEERVGQLKLESTPAGAEAVIDGKSYGQTPLSIPMIAAGSHTLVLKSSAGAITKQFTVKANQTTMLSEAIFSGWLAVFAPFPVNVLIDGQPVNLTDDGRVMTTPGKHVVELVAERFDYRSSETLNVKPGETTAHTLVAPKGTLRIATTPGVEIRIDGELATGSPSDGLSVAIGPHEIAATHPVLGERRVSVDVRHGSLTEVSLTFD